MFHHEKLKVYQKAIDFIAQIRPIISNRRIERITRDQLIRASQSIALNIAEGNGRFGKKDRNRFFTFARGSSYECAAIMDILFVNAIIDKQTQLDSKKLLNEIANMLFGLAKI